MYRKKPLDMRVQMIRSCRNRVGITSDTELRERLGMKNSTFAKRLDDHGSWRLYELRALFRITDMSDEDILIFVKGGGK